MSLHSVYLRENARDIRRPPRVSQDAQSPDSLSGVAVVPPDQALTKWQLAEEGQA